MSANPSLSCRVWDSSRLAPLLAALSAISLPERQTCAGTHWKRTSVPRVISWCTTVPITSTRSSRALVESERMESADLESLQITIAHGGVRTSLMCWSAIRMAHCRPKLLLKCCFTSTETVGLLGTGPAQAHSLTIYRGHATIMGT